MDIILLFIGKSTWYDSWIKTFPNVAKYPEMVKWLKSEGDQNSDLEVWGQSQSSYSFSDLITWLGNEGTLVVEEKAKKGKGKEKEKGKEKVSHKGGSSKAARKYPQFASFPSIAFKDFSDFILGNFGPTISLSTVITLLLSMTNNTELLSLHFKQAKKGGSAAWIKCLARAIKEQLGSDTTKTLFSASELSTLENTSTRNPDIIPLAKKLSRFSQTLELYPYNQKRKFTGTLKPVSHDSIQPALLICPRSSVCLTSGCNKCSLQQNSRPRDIPRVTLIKGTTIHHNVQLLSGCCNNCKTIYYADHERIPASEDTEATKFFLNSAHYLKVGQKLWVNHEFSSAVLNAMYYLHASASGFMNFFNDTYGNENLKLSRRHIWAAFVYESIRQVSDASGVDFSIRDISSVDEVIQTAFITLGKNGIIQSAENHSSAAEVAQSSSNNPTFQNSESEMNVEVQNVTMVVVDGIVVGTKVFYICNT
ncbi:hypothetical protein BYT27DRAFT_7224681 [Phlegmacium glaucopus]|nr:hypothetical protein BYT27DRAFT_7224681 [Phlegmacium glaucopus]